MLQKAPIPVVPDAPRVTVTAPKEPETQLYLLQRYKTMPLDFRTLAPKGTEVALLTAEKAAYKIDGKEVKAGGKDAKISVPSLPKGKYYVQVDNGPIRIDYLEPKDKSTLVDENRSRLIGISLRTKPEQNVEYRFDGVKDSLIIDTDNDPTKPWSNGLRFSPGSWNIPVPVRVYYDVDDLGKDVPGRRISVTVNDKEVQSFEAGAMKNKYTPSGGYDIIFDYKADFEHFFEDQKNRDLMDMAARRWQTLISSTPASAVVYKGDVASTVNRDQSIVRDVLLAHKVKGLLVIVGSYRESHNTSGWARTSAEHSNGTAKLARMGFNLDAFANQRPIYQAQVFPHEVGHALGLVGVNSIGLDKLLPPGSNFANAVEFDGTNSRALNGGTNIKVNLGHAGNSTNPVTSIMSAETFLTIPTGEITPMDKSLLKDHGYTVK